MNSVEIVRALCKERKIAISKLERELGYSNGYISQLRKGVFPHNRLFEIANYLGVTTADLVGDNEKKPTQEGELTEMQLEAVELIKGMSDDQLRVFIATAKAMMGE